MRITIDVDGVVLGIAKRDEDVGSARGRVGDALPVRGRVVVLLEDDVVAGVGARAGPVRGRFGGEAGVLVREGGGGEGGEDDGEEGGVHGWVSGMFVGLGFGL